MELKTDDLDNVNTRNLRQDVGKIADEQQYWYVDYFENLMLGAINLSQIGEATFHKLLAVVINTDMALPRMVAHIWEHGKVIRSMKMEGWCKRLERPKRSATVFDTCGAETKLISAGEPNICEYESQMESYMRCDKKFMILNL